MIPFGNQSDAQLPRENTQSNVVRRKAVAEYVGKYFHREVTWCVLIHSNRLVIASIVGRRKRIQVNTKGFLKTI